MKILASKAAVDKEWGKLEKVSAWNLTKVRNKSEVIDEAKMSGTKVHFASLMDMCHLKMKNTKVELYSKVIFDSGSYAVFTEHKQVASQMTAVKIKDDIFWENPMDLVDTCVKYQRRLYVCQNFSPLFPPQNEMRLYMCH